MTATSVQGYGEFQAQDKRKDSKLTIRAKKTVQPFVLMASTSSHQLKRPGMHKLAALQAGRTAAIRYCTSNGANRAAAMKVSLCIRRSHRASTRAFLRTCRGRRTLPKLEEVLGTMPKVKGVGLIIAVKTTGHKKHEGLSIAQ